MFITCAIIQHFHTAFHHISQAKSTAKKRQRVRVNKKLAFGLIRRGFALLASDAGKFMFLITQNIFFLLLLRCFTFLFMFHLSSKNEREEGKHKKIRHVSLIYQSNAMLIFNVRTLKQFVSLMLRYFVSRLAHVFKFHSPLCKIIH